ncbi:ABC transporter permease [Umezawaea beigongshangensis]|uniref:ABC transporter permease n=1 Tax=Umezawaea beigongshangensis TaxID=2780383 RepID=UPI0018F1DC75|nr:ABC transporter permease [Umezawaea beigongshangensis]
MIDTVASEWMKLRTVRSTLALFASVVVALASGALISYLMTADHDRSSPAERELFGAADPSTVVIPYAQICAGVVGALCIASEHGTGMIRSVLTAVPRRAEVLAAKAVVVGAVSLLFGLVTALACAVSTLLITGGRPAPIAPFASFADALPAVFAGAASVAVVGLVGLGLGALVRSSAGALMGVSVLLFVLPVVANLLPHPWNVRGAALTLPYLVPQLSGDVEGAPLTPLGAAAVAAGYLVLFLGAGGAALLRRDA